MTDQQPRRPPYPVGARFFYKGCYHEFEGKPHPRLELRAGRIANDNTVYIEYPKLCRKCEGRPEESHPVHWACGHEYTGDMDDQDIRRENFFDPVRDMQFSRAGFTISHPRWCPDCIYERSFQIYKDHQFVPNGYRGTFHNDPVYHLAWNLGIRQGRIEALSKDFRPALDDDYDPLLAEVLSGMRDMDIRDEMDKISSLISQTALAINTRTIPFNVPTSTPAPEEARGRRTQSVRKSRGRPAQLRDRSRSPQRDTIFTRQRSRSPSRPLAESATYPINYYATWHPRTDDHRRTNSDQLASRWSTEIGKKGAAELLGIQSGLKNVYIDARNKGLLYQFRAEGEVLWEPEGERRSKALARTTRGFSIEEQTEGPL